MHIPPREAGYQPCLPTRSTNIPPPIVPGGHPAVCSRQASGSDHVWRVPRNDPFFPGSASWSRRGSGMTGPGRVTRIRSIGPPRASPGVPSSSFNRTWNSATSSRPRRARSEAAIPLHRDTLSPHLGQDGGLVSGPRPLSPGPSYPGPRPKARSSRPHIRLANSLPMPNGRDCPHSLGMRASSRKVVPGPARMAPQHGHIVNPPSLDLVAVPYEPCFRRKSIAPPFSPNPSNPSRNPGIRLLLVQTRIPRPAIQHGLRENAGEGRRAHHATLT